jgi:hypothetical protein
MSNLGVELGDQLSDIECVECGGTHKSAYGFVYKDGDAFGLYFATLHTGHAEPSVGLTLSVGKWWDDDAVDERSWIFLRVWAEDNEYRMRLLDPALSHHRNYKALGSPLKREVTLDSPFRDDFYRVADYIVENDPAVTSYLNTGTVDLVRWQEKRDQQPE